MNYKGRNIKELSEEELREGLRDVLTKYNTALYELIAIKTGVINIAPADPRQNWTVKKISTLRDAKEHAGRTLERLGYRNPYQ